MSAANYIDAVMTNAYIDGSDSNSSDAYYLFSDGMEEKYGKSDKADKADKPKSGKRKKPSYRALFGGDNEELSESAEADYTTSISPVLNTANISTSSDRAKSDKSNKANKADKAKSDISDIDTRTQATGGFPPIYIISKEAKEKEKTKQRELATRDSAVSIMDILKRKKI